MFVCCECCVLSGRGLCDELITRPEESYRLWCVVVCDLETSRMRRPWPALGHRATAKKSQVNIVSSHCRLIGIHWPRPGILSHYCVSAGGVHTSGGGPFEAAPARGGRALVPGGTAGRAGSRAGASHIWEHAGQERKYRLLVVSVRAPSLNLSWQMTV